MTVFLTPAGEPFFGGTYFPPAAARPAGLPAAARRGRRRVPRAPRRGRRARRARSSTPCARGRAAPVVRAADRGRPRGAARAPPLDSTRIGRLGGAPKFPPAAALELLLRRGRRAASRGREDARRDGAGGMYDLVGGGFHRYSVDEGGSSRTSRRCSTTTRCSPRVPARLGVPGNERYRAVAEQTLDYMLRELCARRRVRVRAGRRHRRRRGVTFTWTAEEEVPESCSRPFEHGRIVIRGELDEASRARLLEIREHARSRRATTRRSSWNGLALAALAEAGRHARARRPARRGDAAREFCSARSRTSDGRLAPRGRATGPGFLDDYANVAHGLSSSTSRPASSAGSRRRTGSPGSRSSASATTSAAASSCAPGRREARHGEERPRRPSDAVRQLDARVRAAAAARIYGDDELERAAVGVLRLLLPMLERAPGVRLGARRARPPPLAAPRARDPRPPTTRSPALRSPLGSAHRRRVRARRRRAAARGQDPRGRKAALYLCERFTCRMPVTDPDASLTNRHRRCAPRRV